jgi:hypothetical protein
MIHYELCCKDGHVFDGWFKDSGAFETQAKSGLLECPTCGTADVTRALMAPAVSRRAQPPATIPQATQPVPTPGTALVPATPPELPMALDGARIPAQVRAALQKLRAEVETHCDYVGPSFAEEARRIHAGESEKRGIYGEATPEQAEALAEDGIPVARIPWVPRADG